MKILINGETKEVADRLSLHEIVQQLSLGERKVAVELNDSVIRRGDWTSVTVRENDRIEIVHFVGGG